MPYIPCVPSLHHRWGWCSL